MKKRLTATVKVRVSGPGVAWVKSKDIINSEPGQRQLKALKRIKCQN